MRNKRFTSTLLPVHFFATRKKNARAVRRIFDDLTSFGYSDPSLLVRRVATRSYRFDMRTVPIKKSCLLFDFLRDTESQTISFRRRVNVQMYETVLRFNHFLSLAIEFENLSRPKPTFFQALVDHERAHMAYTTTVHARSLFTFSLLCHQTLIPIRTFDYSLTLRRDFLPTHETKV